MLPIENEPNGLNENQKRNDSEITDENKELEKEDTNSPNNSIAGNEDGNLPPEEKEDSEDESATDNGGKGFLGDFAKPQHDD